MKALKILLVITLITLTACSNSNSKQNKNILADVKEISKDNDGLKLLQQNCYACHSVTSKSHDEIIAPPMVAVKRRYKMTYMSENEFVKALTDWVLDPKEENALMFGAVQNFKVMPKQPFNKEEVVKIATYIFNNELEKPSWFESHFNDEHPNGMGKGNGKGRGMFKNN
ncbi:c-type cytochrome [Lutibacter oceani]|nr:c-type cytochrome [Lutibacter oceani]